MQLDLGRHLKNLDGSDAIEDGGPATALKGFRTALVSDPPNLSSSDKAKRYSLFVKLSLSPDADFTIDDVAVLKTAVEVYPTLIYGQLIAVLNQH